MNLTYCFLFSANTRLADPYDYTTEPQPIPHPFNVGLTLTQFSKHP